MRDCPRDLNELVSLLKMSTSICGNSSPRGSCSGIRDSRSPENRTGSCYCFDCSASRGRRSVDSVQYLAFQLHSITVLAMATGRVGSAGVGQQFVPASTERSTNHSLLWSVSSYACDPVPGLPIGKTCQRTAIAQDEPRVVLVGAGALGSQIHDHLSRMGWGRWSVIDQDTLLPHNVARHRLGEMAVGISKVSAIQQITAIETPHNPLERAFLADAQACKITKKCWPPTALRTLSGRLYIHRSREICGTGSDSAARRASLFVNPRVATS